MRPMTLLCPDRLRKIERPFAWLPCRFLTDGWLATLSTPATLLYLLLALAADRRGLSCYGDSRIATDLGLADDDLRAARRELEDAELLTYDGYTYQLLPLPAARPPPPKSKSPEVKSEMPEHIRQTLHRIFGSYAD